MASRTSAPKSKKDKEPDQTKPAANVQVFQVPTDKKPEQVLSQLASEGVFDNAATVVRFTKPNNGKYCDIGEAVNLLRQNIKASKQGDSSLADRLLVSQSIALNAIFNEMARRASLNMGECLEASETYLRLALKAQSQCRATLESLAKIKNPPNVAFVKQANIAQNQQVNNGHVSDSPARTEKTESAPIELLENNHGEWVVTGTTGQAIGGNQAMAAVETLNGATDGRGKNQGKP